MVWSRIDDEEVADRDVTEDEGIVEHELHELIVCLKWLVSLSERSVYQDRLVKFFGILASMATTRARIKSVEVLVTFLVEWSQVWCFYWRRLAKILVLVFFVILLWSV